MIATGSHFHHDPPDYILPNILISIKVVLNSFAFLLNCILLWLIIKHHRALHKTYVILLCYTLVNDLLISTTSLFTINRLMICHDALVSVYYGPCTYISSSLCSFLDGVHLHSLQNWILSQILLIAFRTAVLSSSQSFLLVRKTLIYCFLAWLPGFITLVFHIVFRSSSTRLLNSLQQCYDLEDISTRPISGYASFYNSPMPLSLALLLLPNIPHYFLVFCFRQKQNTQMKRRTLSTTTLKMHCMLRKISTMKAFLPLFLLFDVLIYFFCQLEILPPQFTEYFLGTISSSISILNPLIAIKCFRPYRLTFLGYVRCFTARFKFTPRQKVMFTEGNSEEIVNL